MNEKHTPLNRLDYQNSIIDNLNSVINYIFPEFLELFFQIAVKISLLIAAFYLVYFILRRIFFPIIKHSIKKSMFHWDDILLNNKVFNSVIKTIPILVCYKLVPWVFYNHPDSNKYVDKIFFLILLFLFYQFFFRILNSINDISSEKEGNYRSVAVRSFTQLTKIVTILLGIFLFVFNVFNIDIKAVITVIGAITAVVLLVFRDPILGFVTGLHVSMSRMIKVGDWITIPKYNLEGNILEINLITTKIENLDKIVSSIPTYDLISTEIRNHEPMRKNERRRIKRAIIFNIKSFKFLDEKLEQKLTSIPLLKKYLEDKKTEIDLFNQNILESGKGNLMTRQLTNIGIFRKYIRMYLENHPNIVHDEMLMVRQLETTPQGLPLEIYCFSNTSEWLEFEVIQADIFDHLLTISKDFDLKIVQSLTA